MGRSYHIFYQLLQPFIPDLKAKCLLDDDIYYYSYVSQGKTTVASIDDNEELEYTDSAFDILGFHTEEKWNCYKLTAAVMTMGEMKFKQKGREEQCEPDAMDVAGKVATCLGVDAETMMKAFCKPRIKVGTEWVTKGQNIDQSMKKCNFVAVLDIAGFEMFEYNGFEQISINFVNEKLQQFFNHHMFVVEQEEYVSEGIDWVMVDFGMDAAAAIIMFEKPMGLWAILEEESLFPKATDKSFEEKLKASLGKLPIFLKPQSKTDKNAHFAIQHYAGIVSYNVTGWLEKNKDPVNDTVVEIFKSTSSNNLLVHLWRDHPGQPTSAPKEEAKGKKKKGGGGKTVSSVYLVQLTALMNTLHSTEPHFIRCIVPNTHKQPGGVEPPLIMHQLTCNGVLEGIRICMRGFPNRILYPDFKSRYYILGKEEIYSSDDNKTAVYAMMDKIGFDREKYRLGHTKVFFKAGALAGLEEMRDELVLKYIRWLQGRTLGFMKREWVYGLKKDQRDLILVIQRQYRQYFKMKSWGWWTLISRTKPLIGALQMEEVLNLLQERVNETYGKYMDQVETKKRLDEECKELQEEKKALMTQLESEQGNLGEYTERQQKACAALKDLETALVDAGNKLIEMEQARIEATEAKKVLEGDNQVIKKDMEDLEIAIQKLEQEKTNRDHIIRNLNDEIANQDEIINKLNKEKKLLNENNAKATEDMQVVQEKADHLEEIKQKLENTMDELNDSLTREKRARGDIEKQRR